MADNRLVPFDPSRHTPQDVGHGGPSTEYLMTENAPEGGYWNIPSIWWDAQNNPTEVSPLHAAMLARQYEQQTGQRFPRFGTPQAGVDSAKARSASGGATRIPLAGYTHGR